MKVIRTMNSNAEPLVEMALEKADAIELCNSKGKAFIEHFHKIYGGGDSIEFWAKEMQAQLDFIREKKLKYNNKPINKDQLRDWFFTAGAYPNDVVEMSDKELDDYNNMCSHILLGDTVKQALIKIKPELSDILVEKIVKKKDGYYVQSEKGKNLGGPYDTEDKAKERLQQVHYFKNKDKKKVNEAPDKYGLPTDDELEQEFAARRTKVAQQRADAIEKEESENTKLEGLKSEIKAMFDRNLTKVMPILKRNKLFCGYTLEDYNSFDPWYLGFKDGDRKLTHSSFGEYRNQCMDIAYNLSKDEVEVKIIKGHNVDECIKWFHSSKAPLSLRTIKGEYIEKATDRMVNSLKDFGVDTSGIDGITDVSSGSHWRWGCKYYVFSIKNKFYWFEGYVDRVYNAPIDYPLDTGIYHFAQIEDPRGLDYIKNTDEYKIIKDFKTVSNFNASRKGRKKIGEASPWEEDVRGINGKKITEGAEGKKEPGFEYVIYRTDLDKEEKAPIIAKRSTKTEAEYYTQKMNFRDAGSKSYSYEKVPKGKFRKGDDFWGPFDSDYNIKEDWNKPKRTVHKAKVSDLVNNYPDKIFVNGTSDKAEKIYGSDLGDAFDWGTELNYSPRDDKYANIVSRVDADKIANLRYRLADINKAVERGEDPEHYAYEKERIFNDLDKYGVDYYVDESLNEGLQKWCIRVLPEVAPSLKKEYITKDALHIDSGYYGDLQDILSYKSDGKTLLFDTPQEAAKFKTMLADEYNCDLSDFKVEEFFELGGMILDSLTEDKDDDYSTWSWFDGVSFVNEDKLEELKERIVDYLEALQDPENDQHWTTVQAISFGLDDTPVALVKEALKDLGIEFIRRGDFDYVLNGDTMEDVERYYSDDNFDFDMTFGESLREDKVDITDEANAAYERIIKKFPDISDDELEDRLYSAVANILSGYNFVDGDKSKNIDRIVNILLKNKRRKNESLNEAKDDIPEKSNLLKALHRFDENGKFAKQGKWKIGRGGYDLAFQISYDDLPLLDGIYNGSTTDIRLGQKTYGNGCRVKTLAKYVCSIYGDCEIIDESLTEAKIKATGNMMDVGGNEVNVENDDVIWEVEIWEVDDELNPLTKVDTITVGLSELPDFIKKHIRTKEQAKATESDKVSSEGASINRVANEKFHNSELFDSYKYYSLLNRKVIKNDLPSGVSELGKVVGRKLGIKRESVDKKQVNEKASPEGYSPKKTGKAYKVFRVKNGKLYPPMVANAGGQDTPIGVWLDAEEGEFAGLSKTGRPQVKSTGSGNLAYRPGWHLGDVPRASQFDRKNKETGEMEFPADFVWAECDYAMDVDYQPEADEQGHMRTKVDSEGNVSTYRSDKYQHSLAGLPKLPKDGYYKYRTNPRPDTVPWVITGQMKVNRLLSDAEVNEILEKNGIAPIHRQGGDKTLAELGLAGK